MVATEPIKVLLKIQCRVREWSSEYRLFFRVIVKGRDKKNILLQSLLKVIVRYRRAESIRREQKSFQIVANGYLLFNGLSLQRRYPTIFCTFLQVLRTSNWNRENGCGES